MNHLQDTMASSATKRRLTKAEWKTARGASPKPKRLHLQRDTDGDIFYCPVAACDHPGFTTDRGCRKHVTQRHGWWFYFDEKPNADEVFSDKLVPTRSDRNRHIKLRASTSTMPSFDLTSRFGKDFSHWLTSDWGGSKSSEQATQIARRVLKFLRFCYPDAEQSWDITEDAIDSSIACTRQLTEFISCVREQWQMGYPGTIAYINALGDAIDYRKSKGGFKACKDVLDVVEILLSRTRKSISKKMRAEWNTTLDVDYLDKLGCWATLEEIQSVLPYHQPRFMRIIADAKKGSDAVRPYDLSFCTHFIVAMLFLDVKASRPMTYQLLTVEMVQSIKENEGQGGVIDQNQFKTSERYGFDTLIFEQQHLEALDLYIRHVRPHFESNSEDILLVTRHGKKLTKLSSILGNLVYTATGKYIHPTRLRQIVETESSTHLSAEQQAFVSENQKHTSQVARIKYKKFRSRDVAAKAKEALATIGKTSTLSSLSPTENSASEHNATTTNIKTEDADDTKRPPPAKKVPFSVAEDKCLINGIKQYGWGRWTQILHDSTYHFHPKRTCQTLHQRAVLRKMRK